MLRRAHLLAALLAMLCIAGFFLSTLGVELFGSAEAVARLKGLIVMPGLLVLVPAIAVTGGSGAFLARGRKGRIADAKRRRMPFIAANGLLVLVPCAVVLDRWAAAGSFDAAFYGLQALELLAGGTNLVLMGLNFRDGLRLSGRLGPGAGLAAGARAR